MFHFRVKNQVAKMLKYVYATGILFSLIGNFVWAGDYRIVNKVFGECFQKNALYTCLTAKAIRAMDRAVDLDVPLFDGFVLKRNEEEVGNITESRSASGLKDLAKSLTKFLDTHTLTLDLSESRGNSGGFGFGKVGKRDRKYLYYAMVAVLGILGLSTPLILKGLALVAGQALLASKAALIIIGSVALKKIFQSEKDTSPVQVHTHTVPLDDHDRYFNTGGYPYMSY